MQITRLLKGGRREEDIRVRDGGVQSEIHSVFVNFMHNLSTSISARDRAVPLSTSSSNRMLQTLRGTVTRIVFFLKGNDKSGSDIKINNKRGKERDLEIN